MLRDALASFLAQHPREEGEAEWKWRDRLATALRDSVPGEGAEALSEALRSAVGRRDHEAAVESLPPALRRLWDLQVAAADKDREAYRSIMASNFGKPKGDPCGQERALSVRLDLSPFDRTPVFHVSLQSSMSHAQLEEPANGLVDLRNLAGKLRALANRMDVVAAECEKAEGGSTPGQPGQPAAKHE